MEVAGNGGIRPRSVFGTTGNPSHPRLGVSITSTPSRESFDRTWRRAARGSRRCSTNWRMITRSCRRAARPGPSRRSRSGNGLRPPPPGGGPPPSNWRSASTVAAGPRPKTSWSFTKRVRLPPPMSTIDRIVRPAPAQVLGILHHLPFHHGAGHVDRRPRVHGVIPGGIQAGDFLHRGQGIDEDMPATRAGHERPLTRAAAVFEVGGPHHQPRLVMAADKAGNGHRQRLRISDMRAFLVTVEPGVKRRHSRASAPSRNPTKSLEGRAASCRTFRRSQRGVLRTRWRFHDPCLGSGNRSSPRPRATYSRACPRMTPEPPWFPPGRRDHRLPRRRRLSRASLPEHPPRPRAPRNRT